MILVPIGILVLYLLFLVLVAVAWQSLSGNSNQQHQEGVSIIIAMRNEALNLPPLLQSLQNQDYSGPFEVILVDDASEDQSISVAETFGSQLQLKVLRLPNAKDARSRKKLALTYGVDQARYELILVTDADCILPESWIQLTANFQKSKAAQMVCGLVRWAPSSWSLQPLLDLEFAALQATGAAGLFWGSPNMCNGANLAFTKEAFKKVNGYSGYEQVISGDDEFLLQKVWSQYPGAVHYLKHQETVVTTQPPTNFGDFWHQRRRWSGKWKYHTRLSTRLLAIFIVLVHLSFLIMAAFLVTHAAWRYLLLTIILLKIVVEAILLIPVLSVQGRSFHLGWFLLGQLLYSPYTLVFGIAANFGTFSWKNRTYK